MIKVVEQKQSCSSVPLNIEEFTRICRFSIEIASAKVGAVVKDMYTLFDKERFTRTSACSRVAHTMPPPQCYHYVQKY